MRFKTHEEMRADVDRARAEIRKQRPDLVGLSDEEMDRVLTREAVARMDADIARNREKAGVL